MLLAVYRFFSNVAFHIYEYGMHIYGKSFIIL